ncbi:MAG: neutral/alkaline non-lysosomal ceramidase N-terminal domain-containing protein [Myxococcales bacterium]|nr:neutral/alkaline non-lysosomal ceramidase N-terminal domain-containing protein [Myxococcales bacterium]
MSAPWGLRRAYPRALAPLVVVGALAACGDDGGTNPPPIDAGPSVTTAHCSFEPVAANASVGTSAAAAPLSAGAGEVPLDVPVGTALGGYTARGAFLGMADKVDNREVPLAGGFFPSVGIESRPMAKALALRAGGETVVWIKIDAIFAYEGFVFDLEQRLGAEYRGKIILSTSHSHAAWAQYTSHSPLKVGASERRKIVGDRILAGCEAAARAALADLRPARIGFATDTNFDPTDAISRERRGENDALPGGNRKDDRLHLIRVDAANGDPIAIVPIFGMHGTIGDADNPMASTDAPGAIERMLEEQFDREVVVMHVQSAGADVSPSGHGSVDCNVHPGNPSDPCFNFLATEGNGRAAVPILMAAWTEAGAAMQDQLALSMVTRSIELGPKPDTFKIRGGALAYAPFDLEREADRTVYDGDGALVSPIDEYNAPVGAALCEGESAMFPAAAMPNTDGLKTYGSCVRLDIAGDVIGQLLRLDLSDIGVDRPACQTTRTTISALRLGDYLVATMPGELSVLLSDKLRAASPVDSAHTITVGYSQGHVGYMLTPEDWLLGGYEPSVTFWGPLESEYIVERSAELLPLAMMPMRLDGAAAGTDRIVPPPVTDGFPIDNPATRRGTVPATVPADLWMRAGRPATSQPPATVARVSGLATFVWYGDDPQVKTPIVTLEREVGPAWQPVRRRSGRPVADADVLVYYAPVPLIRESAPQDHVWAVEWQPVPWIGSGAVADGLERRGATPLVNYRFHVVGDGWELSSDPFQVVPAPLTVTATRTNTQIAVEVSLHAPQGYRLLDLTNASNRPVRLKNNAVTVVGRDGGGATVGAPLTATTSAAGLATVDFGAAAGQVVSVTVTDSDGNHGDDAL